MRRPVRPDNNAWWAPGARTFLRSRSGTIARLLRHPMLGPAPWRRTHLKVARNGGIGDVLLCTPALRELKRKNPTCRVDFYSNHPALVRGLPYIDQVLQFAERPSDAIYLRYEDAIPPRAHFAKIIGDNLGLDVRDVRPDCVIDRKLVAAFRALWQRLPRPHIIVQRRASRWTPNKNWLPEYWIQLIKGLATKGSVLEIGTGSPSPDISAENYVDLRGQPLEELVAAVAAGDILVGPASGPSHVAAAVGTPAVIIIGGYEHPCNSSYRGNVGLYTPTSCSPCWLKEPCPYQLKCLSAIGPATVETVIWETLAKRKHAAGKISEPVITVHIGE